MDTEIDRDITIKVTDTWEDREEGEAHEFGEEEQDGWEEFEPELLDFSDGEPYGTILIDSEPYGAVRMRPSVWVGEGKVYEIPLKNDYAGCARVRLPVGMYYESGTIHVELAEKCHGAGRGFPIYGSIGIILGAGGVTIRLKREKPLRSVI